MPNAFSPRVRRTPPRPSLLDRARRCDQLLAPGRIVLGRPIVVAERAAILDELEAILLTTQQQLAA